MSGRWTPSETDLEGLFDPLRAYARVILAVSGGPDSMALMHLAAAWAEGGKGVLPTLSVATVDHGLRPGSAGEAALVVAAARRIGLEAEVLAWQGDKPQQGIQERARQQRYLLLGRHAARGAVGPCAIATAHTRDDQAETLLMRLARGSGPDGLQSMRPVRLLSPHGTVFLVRPLLGIGRDQLRAYLADHAIEWIEDPSNEDRRFERVRLREAAGALNELGLSASVLALAAERQRRAVKALEAATDDLHWAALDVHHGAFASIDGLRFAAAPEEIRIRLMTRILSMFGGATPPPELAQVERLIASLANDAWTRTTLGGCEVKACRNEIRIYREPGRAALEPVELKAGEETTWDNRFAIRIGERAPAPVVVRPLDRISADVLRRRARPRFLLPARAAATLPAVWAGDELVAVGGVPAALFAGMAQPRAGVEARCVFAPAVVAR